MKRIGMRGAASITAALWVATAAPWAGAATPAMGIGVQAGTTGIGLNYDIALSPSFTARIGYSGFNYDHSVDTSDVDYSGTFKLSMVTGIIDWYAFDGGFHLSVGAVGDGTRLDVTGQPAAAGSYTINGHSYTSGDVGSLTGQLKFGDAVSPYVGLGWGNPVGLKHHLHFLFDVGAIYGGTPNVTLTAACGSAAPPGSAVCTQLQSDVQAEKLKLRNDVSILQWYPVIDLGLAYRF
ncbi:MAG TPA: hypothetical protein VHX52_12535 [Steroidobacteraceae bacterium]|nr:hypothetical protein [Steroidobacteraceae bacterium]